MNSGPEIGKVVVVGAGFAGLSATKAMAHAPVEITLIDRHNYHLFQSLLYQVATAALTPAKIAAPIRGMLRKRQNVTVLMDEVTGVDADTRPVKTRGGRSLPSDAPVLATGARPCSGSGRSDRCRVSQHLCNRRYRCPRSGKVRASAARRRTGCETDGQLCRTPPCTPVGRKARVQGLPLCRLWFHGNDRPQPGNRGNWTVQDHRIPGLAPVGSCPCVLLNRLPQPPHRDAELGLVLRDLAARCSSHNGNN